MALGMPEAIGAAGRIDSLEIGHSIVQFPAAAPAVLNLSTSLRTGLQKPGAWYRL